MILDLQSEQAIERLHFNWGNNPPISYQVFAGHAIDSMTEIASGNVTISAPYDSISADEVAVKVGNVTDVGLENSIGVRYLNVTIVGSFARDGRGGTVAEFVVL